jgi:hypothetical protein
VPAECGMSRSRRTAGKECSKRKEKPAHTRAILYRLAPASTGALDYRMLIT